VSLSELEEGLENGFLNRMWLLAVITSVLANIYRNVWPQTPECLTMWTGIHVISDLPIADLR
jgi:hypothetical protein